MIKIPRSYLPHKYFVATLIILFILFSLECFLAFFLLIIIYCIFFTLFLKNKSYFREDFSEKKEMIFAPISGHIVSINTNCDHDKFGVNLSEVKILLPWWKRYGVHLPMSATVNEIDYSSGKSIFRYLLGDSKNTKQKNLSGLNVLLKNENDETIGLQFIKCRFGMYPRLSVLSGDRGLRQGEMGLFPFGGVVLLYFPANYEILVQKNTKVKAATTPIAALPL